LICKLFPEDVLDGVEKVIVEAGESDITLLGVNRDGGVLAVVVATPSLDILHGHGLVAGFIITLSQRRRLGVDRWRSWMGIERG